MLQVKKRKDGKMGWRFMSTVCFYQDSRHREPLVWIRRQLGIGYLSDRNDGISELRINGFVQIRKILDQLLPYIRFKKIQAKELLKALSILSQKKSDKLTGKDIKHIAEAVWLIRQENYQSGKKKDQTVDEILDLTPYRLSLKERDGMKSIS